MCSTSCRDNRTTPGQRTKARVALIAGRNSRAAVTARAPNHSCAPTEEKIMHLRQKMTATQRLLAWFALHIAVVGGVGICLLMTPAVVMSAGCCPGPSCGTGPGTGSGTPEG